MFAKFQPSVFASMVLVIIFFQCPSAFALPMTSQNNILSSSNYSTGHHDGHRITEISKVDINKISNYSTGHHDGLHSRDFCDDLYNLNSVQQLLHNIRSKIGIPVQSTINGAATGTVKILEISPIDLEILPPTYLKAYDCGEKAVAPMQESSELGSPTAKNMVELDEQEIFVICATVEEESGLDGWKFMKACPKQLEALQAFMTDLRKTRSKLVVKQDVLENASVMQWEELEADGHWSCVPVDKASSTCSPLKTARVELSMATTASISTIFATKAEGSSAGYTSQAQVSASSLSPIALPTVVSTLPTSISTQRTVTKVLTSTLTKTEDSSYTMSFTISSSADGEAQESELSPNNTPPAILSRPNAITSVAAILITSRSKSCITITSYSSYSEPETTDIPMLVIYTTHIEEIMTLTDQENHELVKTVTEVRLLTETELRDVQTVYTITVPVVVTITEARKSTPSSFHIQAAGSDIHHKASLLKDEGFQRPKETPDQLHSSELSIFDAPPASSTSSESTFPENFISTEGTRDARDLLYIRRSAHIGKELIGNIVQELRYIYNYRFQKDQVHKTRPVRNTCRFMARRHCRDYSLSVPPVTEHYDGATVGDFQLVDFAVEFLSKFTPDDLRWTYLILIIPMGLCIWYISQLWRCGVAYRGLSSRKAHREERRKRFRAVVAGEHREEQNSFRPAKEMYYSNSFF